MSEDKGTPRVDEFIKNSKSMIGWTLGDSNALLKFARQLETELQEMQRERDEAVQRMKAGWIEVCQSGLADAIARAEKAEASLQEMKRESERDENLRDIGEDFLMKLRTMDPSYSWNDCPTEWVSDQINEYDELVASLSVQREQVLTEMQVKEFRRENTVAISDPLPDWAIEENRVLHELCDFYLAALPVSHTQTS